MGVHPLTQADPHQKLAHIVSIGVSLHARDAQGQGHILKNVEMVYEPKILKNNTNSSAQRDNAAARGARRVLAKQAHNPARRRMTQEHQPEKRALAGARRPGQKMERARGQLERHVAQDFRASAIAQPHVLERDSRFGGGGVGANLRLQALDIAPAFVIVRRNRHAG